MYLTNAEDIVPLHLRNHTNATWMIIFQASPIKWGTSKQSRCNSSLACRKINGRMRNKSKSFQSELNCWVTEGFHYRTDLISNAERILLSHHPSPHRGRRGVTGIQKTVHLNCLVFRDNLHLSESYQLATTFYININWPGESHWAET